MSNLCALLIRKVFGRCRTNGCPPLQLCPEMPRGHGFPYARRRPRKDCHHGATPLTAAAALRQTNRALKVISECHRAVVRATREAELLQQICALLVDHGGYRMAWVGFAGQDAAETLRP